MEEQLRLLRAIAVQINHLTTRIDAIGNQQAMTDQSVKRLLFAMVGSMPGEAPKGERRHVECTKCGVRVLWDEHMVKTISHEGGLESKEVCKKCFYAKV